jgi:uncharacterized protein (DUF1015 family)
MASVRPLKALLPPPDRAAAIASVPYDVVDTDEARALAEGRPWSFLHVVRPEIDLEPGIDLYSEPVYAAAARNLERWIAEVPYALPPGEQALFVYRLVQGDRSQTGVVAGCSVDEYDDGRIAIHERTRQAKEDDRARHVVTMRCQAEPIFLAYRARPEIDARVADVVRGEPLFDFEADDGVRHTIWIVPDGDALAAAFEAVPRLYVADGHHRAKSASRAREALSGGRDDGSPCHRVLSVVFPDSELAILPYNRVLTDLGGRAPEAVLAELDERFGLHPVGSATPARRHDVCVYAAGGWHGFSLAARGGSVVDQLDCSLLQDQVLAPVFGIDDPRTDPRIDFVGGSRGTAELERRADAAGGVAFSLFPTSLAELFAVADAGQIMPPKSTWFEPKLRSGLFLHRI